MDHVTGRHRRRRRGWVNHTRWVVGAILAAIIGVTSTPRNTPAESVPARETPSPVRVPESQHDSGWAQRYGQRKRAHFGRGRALRLDHGARVGPPCPEVPTPLGWCVDDDGVRGVRPYVIQHEQQEWHRRHASGRALTPKQWVTGATAASHTREQPDEWEELAGLVRQWVQQRPACHA